MKVMTYLLSGSYFVFSLIYTLASLYGYPVLFIFALVCMVAGLGILGKGGKLTRFVAYLVGAMVTVCFVYWAIIIFAVSGTEAISLQILVVQVAISFGVLTIYCLKKNGTKI